MGFFIFLVNAADLASTYLASPDLEHEWNILHSKFQLGWPGLVTAKLIGGLLAWAGYAYYLLNRERCYPRQGMDRAAFCRYLLYGRPASWREVAGGVPIGPFLWVNLGYFWAGMQLLVLWVALDNVLLHYGWFCSLRHVSELGYHLGQSLVIGAMVLTRFYSTNYRRYLALTRTAPVPAGAVRSVACEAASSV